MKHKLIKLTQTVSQWYLLDVPDDWDDTKILEAFYNEGVTDGDPHFERVNNSTLLVDRDPTPTELKDYEDSAITLGQPQ